MKNSGTAAPPKPERMFSTHHAEEDGLSGMIKRTCSRTTHTIATVLMRSRYTRRCLGAVLLSDVVVGGCTAVTIERLSIFTAGHMSYHPIKGAVSTSRERAEPNYIPLKNHSVALENANTATPVLLSIPAEAACSIARRFV